ncbi:hypothetical protein ACWDKQ_33045 [Saccharopolyspora sp. NPDC000995]
MSGLTALVGVAFAGAGMGVLGLLGAGLLLRYNIPRYIPRTGRAAERPCAGPHYPPGGVSRERAG